MTGPGESGTDAGQGVIVAIDQGTSATKAIALDGGGHLVTSVTVPVTQSHPRPGWVEQDATAILASVRDAVRQLVAQLDIPVLGVGISSQRESALLWDTGTGQPLGPMLGWQDRRTSAAAAALAENADLVRQRTGLPLDPMFSALKLSWLLDQVDPDRRRSARGEIAAGTVDSWLVYALTGEHRIEIGNASRTQLLNLVTGTWDPDLLDLFRIPAAVLPAVFPSTAATGPSDLPGAPAIHAVLGDSHSALYAHGIRTPGQVKVGYGSGSSVMGLTAGQEAAPEGLTTTIAWQLGGAAHQLAFEGNILSTGATVAWLSRLLNRPVGELMTLARSAEPGPVFLVPAFAGLGAPWWDPGASAVLSGFDLGTDAGTLARAGAESIVHQVEDVLAAADSQAPVTEILADGGPAADDWLMQLQADISGRPVRRESRAELSAWGVALLAAEGLGLTIPGAGPGAMFTPIAAPETIRSRHDAWRDAVALARATPSGRTTP
ncbi:FGGY family carbohydrate kinase [Ruania zhangjianzhongii]|uniref:FGGY family carbohydrate kinase n=1 Tax=Ruania zhangjianzhongii TaxID=2603206 RepID=UPI0011C740F6|nr:FGGY family carbohydrate kinase [Ruania zhangjianzhongii]